jgi:hypothetical protein
LKKKDTSKTGKSEAGSEDEFSENKTTNQDGEEKTKKRTKEKKTDVQ